MIRMLQRFMLCFPMLLVSLAPQAQGIYTVMAVGDVKAVDRETGTVTLDHGPLLNLSIPPSVRVFHVADRAFLEGVKAGDAMRFIADNIGGRLTIVEIETGRPDDHGAH